MRSHIESLESEGSIHLNIEENTEKIEALKEKLCKEKTEEIFSIGDIAAIEADLDEKFKIIEEQFEREDEEILSLVKSLKFAVEDFP